MIQRPGYYPSWTQGTQTQVAQPPDSLRATGFVPGQPPDAYHFNSLLYDLGQWVQYLDQSQNGAVLATTLDASVRLIGGGTLSYTASNTTLSWSMPLYLAVPSIPDADNAIAPGQVSVPAGSVAYVQANVPFSATGDVVSGQTAVQNVSFTLGIKAGQTVTGAGIAAGTTVASVQDTSVTLSQAATATQSAQSLTFSGTGALTLQVAPTDQLVPAANTILLARGMGSHIYVGVNAQVASLHNLEQRTLMLPGYTNIITAAAGQNITQGQALYIARDTGSARTLGAAYPADCSSANGASRANCAGFAIADAGSGTTCRILTAGYLPGFSGLTPGGGVWLDPATPGGLTQTRPVITTTPYIVRAGVAVTANTLLVRPEHIPDGIFPSIQANTVISQAGFRDTFGPAYLTSGQAGGNTGPFTYLVCGTGSTQYIVPTANGSLVGLSLYTDSLSIDGVQLYLIVCTTRANTVVAAGPTVQASIGATDQQYASYMQFPKGQVPISAGAQYALAIRSGSSNTLSVKNVQAYATFEAGA